METLGGFDRNGRDEELVAAARGGDREAFALLIIHHRPLVIALCRRALGDRDQAEDVAQEAILQALLDLDRLRRPDRFGAWLAGIGLNIARRWRRQRLREAWSWEAAIGGSMLPEPIDEEPGPEATAEGAELREWVERAVADLPPGQRVAVKLHYLEGLTQAETAALLGIEVGAVKARLHKARRNLRGHLAAITESGMQRVGGQAMVDMRIADVRRRTGEESNVGGQVVILEEIGGERRLPIWIGEFEAVALALQLTGVPQLRPLTYAFAASLLHAAGAALHEVRIDRLEEHVFYASAILDGKGGEQAVDARPSDALNLALSLQAPIRVSEAVLAQVSVVPPEAEWAFSKVGSEGAAVIAADYTASWPSAPAGQPDAPADEAP